MEIIAFLAAFCAAWMTTGYMVLGILWLLYKTPGIVPFIKAQRHSMRTAFS